jgi:hypothetical protein
MELCFPDPCDAGARPGVFESIDPTGKAGMRLMRLRGQADAWHASRRRWPGSERLARRAGRAQARLIPRTPAEILAAAGAPLRFEELTPTLRVNRSGSPS